MQRRREMDQQVPTKVFLCFYGQALNQPCALHTATKITHFSLSHTFCHCRVIHPSILHSNNECADGTKSTLLVLWLKFVIACMVYATLYEATVSSSLTDFCACVEIGFCWRWKYRIVYCPGNKLDCCLYLYSLYLYSIMPRHNGIRIYAIP